MHKEVREDVPEIKSWKVLNKRSRHWLALKQRSKELTSKYFSSTCRCFDPSSQLVLMEEDRKKSQKWKNWASFCKYSQFLTNLNKFEQVWTSLNRFEQVWTILNRFEHVWITSDILINLRQVWTTSDNFEQVLTSLYIKVILVHCGCVAP